VDPPSTRLRGLSAFPFENATLSIPVAADVAPLLAAISAAAGAAGLDHLTFLVPL
jgi:hypothetical protein